jgi:effector-binding domain-containing protein
VESERARQLTAVVRTTTTWDEFPSLWGALIEEVLEVAPRTGNIVMLYEDDVPTVQVGIRLDEPIEPRGRVINSELPAGRVAAVMHRGPWTEMGRAHDAAKAEAGDEAAGPRWEIYGHHTDDPAAQEVEVVYLLKPRS